MKVNINLKKDRVLIKLLEAENKTESGIIIPETAESVPNEGIIVAVGPNCTENKVDDIVIFSKYGTELIKLDNEDYILTTEEYIIGNR